MEAAPHRAVVEAAKGATAEAKAAPDREAWAEAVEPRLEVPAEAREEQPAKAEAAGVGSDVEIALLKAMNNATTAMRWLAIVVMHASRKPDAKLN